MEKDSKETKEEVKEDVKKEVVTSTPARTTDVSASVTATNTKNKEKDPVTKELEELRKFKSEVEAERKLQKEKAKEVKVSDTFFGKKVNYTDQSTKSNTEKAWEDLFSEGVPRRHE